VRDLKQTFVFWRKISMTKKSYVKFLGLLLVVGLLFAAAPVGQA